MTERLLVVEDDADINELLKNILRKAGYDVTTAFSGTEGLLLLEKYGFDLLLLDLMLPGMTGEELLSKLRRTSRMPVIALTAKGALEDKVQVLEGGADDYMTKPFEKEELLARISAQLRRAKLYSEKAQDDKEKEQEEEKLICRELELYPEYCRALLEGRELSLTTHEFRILEVLMRYPQKVFSKESLYQAVWKNGFYGEDNAVSVHVSNLRKKMAAVSQEEYIKTVWGIGYKLSL